ncbi:MAG: hypothetical protein HC853_19010 [Anaerolineae bacterium]|nr:hypothetical protein [Anaerolineae bacterium]
MNLQKLLPVIASIAIIIAVAILRERSRTLAVIFATMPINMPLALWLLSDTTNGDPAVLSGYVRSLMVGLVPGFIWLLIVFLTLRWGWSLLAALLGAYAVWAVLIGFAFWMGWLSLSK